VHGLQTEAGTVVLFAPEWERPLSWLPVLAAYVVGAPATGDTCLALDARDPGRSVGLVGTLLGHACEYLSEGRDFAEVLLVADRVAAEGVDRIDSAAELVDLLGLEIPQLDTSPNSLWSHARWVKKLVDDLQGMLDRAAFEAASPVDLTRDPLVTVRIATYGAVDLLINRALPSVLNGDYKNVEVLVCSDGPQAHARAAVEAVDDPRVRYLELPERPQYPELAESFWCVAGTLAVNRTLEEARGDLIAPLDHDDAFTTYHIPALIDAMHRNGSDFAYGTAMSEDNLGRWGLIGEPPLRLGAIVHASVMYTRRLAHMRYDGDAWIWREPGDWNLWRRIRSTSAGVSFTPHPVAVHFREQTSIAGKERSPPDVAEVLGRDLRRAGEGKLLTVASHTRGAALASGRRSVRRREPSRGPRLAIVSHAFPPDEWEPSFQEAIELLERRPDTVFFSAADSSERWPRPIYPVAELGALVGPLGITDVYATSLGTAVGVLGLEKHPSVARLQNVVSAPKAPGLRVYAEVEADTRADPALLKAVAERAATVFTSSERALAAAPKAVAVPRSVATDMFAFRSRARRRPFQLLFAGAGDGLGIVLDAITQLDADQFLLHVVGPYEERLQHRPELRAVVHASPAPADLRALCWECDAVIAAGGPSLHVTAALASGCALIGTGVPGLEPQSHFAEAREPDAIAAAIRRLEGDRNLRDRLAEQGAARVRETLGPGAVVDIKLEGMRLTPER
jgi:glycosyltransferase involved in cell wall biosynthesis